MRWALKRFKTVQPKPDSLPKKNRLRGLVERIEQRLIRLRIFAIKVLRICLLLLIGAIAISATYYWSLSPSDREKMKMQIANYTAKSDSKQVKHRKRVQSKASSPEETTPNTDNDVPPKLSRKEKKAIKREEKKRHQYETSEKESAETKAPSR